MKRRHDIIIVGAGPIGSYTAYLLAREGLDVGIFEKNAAVGKDVNCTGIVSAECLKKFTFPAEITSREIRSVKAVAPSGNAMRYFSASPLAYVVNRGDFDSAMNRMAVGAGATVYLGVKVEDFDSSGSDFRVRVNGETSGEFCSKAGVIATGFEVRSLRRIYKRPMHFSFGIQTEVRMRNVGDVEVYFGEKVAPGFFGWVVPTDDDSAKIGLMVKKDPAYFLKGLLQNPKIGDRVIGRGDKVRCSPIPLKRIPKSYAERLVVVGEAAGQVKTTTGGGIYFGLLCAEIAAETIIKSVRSGDYSETAFREYEVRWRKRLDPELRAGAMLRSVFSKLSDRQIDSLMDIAGNDGLKPIIDKTDFDWHRNLISYVIRHLINKKLFGSS